MKDLLTLCERVVNKVLVLRERLILPEFACSCFIHLELTLNLIEKISNLDQFGVDQIATADQPVHLTMYLKDCPIETVCSFKIIRSVGAVGRAVLCLARSCGEPLSAKCTLHRPGTAASCKSHF